ncbi:MAG: type II toxin-antitoxin system RelE/ParE family toxin [Erysipelotrichaceae bacterium]|nr:type II toxin-antitoxin system RelE/ParE family toxin [Erysipelotrichaceae bacterium]
MDNYIVKINPKAVKDLDDIYRYITYNKLSPENAKHQTNRIKNAILDLSVFPYSHQDRLEGRYAGKGYKQLLVDNYIVIYRIDENKKTVYVVTVQYQRRNF